MANLEEKIRGGQFVITAEIVPPLSAASARLLEEAAPLRRLVDAINVTDAVIAGLNAALPSLSVTPLPQQQQQQQQPQGR